ncbi:MAG: adhesin, partial [Betaproteobacteria bacterium]|nr:adhesin [Betaproteobacteria bacterium]
MLALSTSVVDVSCNAGASGAIDLTVTGGTAPYTYLWNDPNASTTEDLSSLTAGTYNVTVTDANGCTASTSATVTQPAALVLTTASTPASCNPDGSASVSVSGGTGAYTYLWSNGAATASLTNLAAGSYSLTVTDANGCSASSNVTVGSLASLTASASVSSPILCNGGTTTVNITATG